MPQNHKADLCKLAQIAIDLSASLLEPGFVEAEDLPIMPSVI